MASQWNLIICVPFLLLILNVKEFECRSPGENIARGSGARPIRSGDFNRALNKASDMITGFPYGISEAVDDASGVFGNVLGMILSKKKVLGLESFYYK